MPTVFINSKQSFSQASHQRLAIPLVHSQSFRRGCEQPVQAFAVLPAVFVAATGPEHPTVRCSRLELQKLLLKTLLEKLAATNTTAETSAVALLILYAAQVQ